MDRLEAEKALVRYENNLHRLTREENKLEEERKRLLSEELEESEKSEAKEEERREA